MTEKIIYFTAGQVPTGEEATAIASIGGLTAPYIVAVRAAVPGGNYEGGDPESADFVMGTIPTAYADTEVYPVFDPANPPDPTLVATKTIISDGEAVAVAPSGAYTSAVTFTVAGGAITAIVLS